MATKRVCGKRREGAKGEVSNLTSPISSNIHNRRRLQAGCEPDPAPEDFTPCNPGQRIRRTTEDISG